MQTALVNVGGCCMLAIDRYQRKVLIATIMLVVRFRYQLRLFDSAKQSFWLRH